MDTGVGREKKGGGIIIWENEMKNLGEKIKTSRSAICVRKNIMSFVSKITTGLHVIYDGLKLCRERLNGVRMEIDTAAGGP